MHHIQYWDGCSGWKEGTFGFPVIRFADSLSLSQDSNQAKSTRRKAQNKELQPKDWKGIHLLFRTLECLVLK